MFLELFESFKHEIVATILVTAFLGIVTWPIKRAKKAWEELNAKLAATLAATEGVHNELSVQRNNCLTTLQSQGDAQIELLEEAVSTLKEMNLSQSRLLGRLDNVHVDFK